MQSIVIVIHLMIVVAMIGVVLLQKSEGGGLGMGSGGGGGFMTNRGAANVLTRATAFLAGAFFLTSLGLSVIAGYSRNPTSIINPTSAPGSSQPAPGGGLLDQLREQEGTPAPAPAPAPAPPAQ